MSGSSSQARTWEVRDDLIRDWLDTLDDDMVAQIAAAAEILEQEGPQLGRPLVDTIRGPRYKNLKELRPGSSGATEVRILFIFDPERRAILLLGGDKSGRWKTWYETSIPAAGRRYEQWCRDNLG